MNVTTEERSLRRRLIYNAMPADTSIEIVQQCIDILENEFGETPDIRYSQLVKRLGESIGSSINFGPVLGRIMMLRNKTPDDIGPDPGVAAKPATVSLDSKGVVFACLFNAICHQVSSRGATRILELKKHFASAASGLDLSTDCKESLAGWTIGDAAEVSFSGEVADLQRIVNSAFVWMCNKFGPVETDKILHRAIHVAEQIPESFEFSPKELM